MKDITYGDLSKIRLFSMWRMMSQYTTRLYSKLISTTWIFYKSIVLCMVHVIYLLFVIFILCIIYTSCTAYFSVLNNIGWISWGDFIYNYLFFWFVNSFFSINITKIDIWTIHSHKLMCFFLFGYRCDDINDIPHIFSQ